MTAIRDELHRCQRYSLAIGFGAAIGCVLGAVFDWQQFLQAYLFAWLFLLGLSLGGLAIVMIHNLTGGAWGLFVRRFAEAQMLMLPLNLVLAIPILFGLSRIYPWANLDVDMAPSGEYHFWRHYLEPWFFYLRATAYFAVWMVLVVLMSIWSRQQDCSPSARSFWRAYKASGIGLVLLGITVHFAAIDWIMSLQPGFTSTLFGPLVFTNQVLSAFSLCIVLCCLLVVRPEFNSVFSRKVMNDLGSLLFTMLVAWAYLAWFQFMLIWMADLPHGNIWYLVRWRDGWGVAGSILVCFQFVLPFAALLLRTVKQSRRALAIVGALVFVGQWIFAYYQVVPLFGSAGWAAHWVDWLSPIALGGIWFAGFLGLLKRRALLPANDLNYQQAVLLREIEVEEFERQEALAHE